MKERIASNIYMSMTGDSPFDTIIDSVGDSLNKISFKIAEDELVNLDDEEFGLLSDYKDLSMIGESENGMIKENDFINIQLDSDYDCESDLSMVKKSENGMIKENRVRADIDSLVMEENEPGGVGSDAKEIAEESAKSIKKVNKTIFKQGAFDDIVGVEDLKLAFPFHSVQVELDKLYSELSNKNDKVELDNVVQSRIKRAYIKWKKYINYVKREAKKETTYRNAYIEAKKANKLFNILANKKGTDWKELFVTLLAKIKRAHEALYLI